DVCLLSNDFEAKLGDLRKFFTRYKEKQLSLSPAKMKLFMSEVLFAGAHLCKDGIKPNLTKVAVSLDWPELSNALKLLSFLRL
ncbi:hypothetical protein M422DRAFT_134688, partial [Sphaerobolus stellatus SS14]